MEFRTEPIQNPVIVRRTFEGKTDPTKNDDALTSKYTTSYKYAVVCTHYGRRRVECFVTKGDAEAWIVRNSVARDL